MTSAAPPPPSWWKRHVNMRTLYLFLLGQLVSFVLALMSFTSSLLANLDVDAPITQSMSTYLLLALVYGGILIHRGEKLRVSWYWYLLLGFVDVQGNYLVNKAYQFSSITSVTLLDCFTIAWVLILTWIFLKARYSIWQLFGAAVCVVGLGAVLLSDAGVAGGGGTQPLLGDVLVIAGTIFFALSNVGEDIPIHSYRCGYVNRALKTNGPLLKFVSLSSIIYNHPITSVDLLLLKLQEFCVKKRDRVEVVCMIGVYGFVVSACQMPILELKSLESVEWSTDIILAFIGYGLAGFMLYTLGPFVLQMSGATLFNLSILTSDMWAVVVRIFIYQQEVDWLYYLSFSIVVIGLIIYSVMETEPDLITSLEDGNTSYQILEDDSTTISRNETSVS